MIISHKYKFLFIGLPFSASSAISKELHLQYNGEPYLRNSDTSTKWPELDIGRNSVNPCINPKNIEDIEGIVN